MLPFPFPRLRCAIAVCALSVGLAGGLSGTPGAQAQFAGYRLYLAEAAASDEDIAAFYRARGFEGIWTGSDPAVIARRNALLAALSDAPIHGLPADRFDPDRVIAALHAAATPEDQARMEVELSRIYLDYARAVQSGLLRPRAVVSQIVRDIAYTPRTDLLDGLVAGDPGGFLRSLPPASPEYVRLMRAKLRIEAQLRDGGWGPAVPASRLDPGARGDAVVALRNRLIAMGFLAPTSTASYDVAMMEAVQKFQETVGLTADGIAGSATIDAINVSPERRLQSVIVAMERERWMPEDRGDRHIWVNLTDFTAVVMDHDRPTFETRSVIGAGSESRQTPEFSDEMDHMVINPSWYVPRSIIVGEYLPALRSNPNAHRQLVITDSRGRAVNRASANFSRYSASTFPYAMRQPPGPDNALGRVKFMFPNPYNIYLHDTPARSLFGREIRTFSHGCVRLNDPLDFAYVLLAPQTDDPVGFFNARLNSGQETRVELDPVVPVHLVYRTAWTDVTGQLHFRADIYNRDARIWEALLREGVVIGAPEG